MGIFSLKVLVFKERSLKANVQLNCDFIFIKTKLTQNIRLSVQIFQIEDRRLV